MADTETIIIISISVPVIVIVLVVVVASVWVYLCCCRRSQENLQQRENENKGQNHVERYHKSSASHYKASHLSLDRLSERNYKWSVVSNSSITSLSPLRVQPASRKVSRYEQLVASQTISILSVAVDEEDEIQRQDVVESEIDIELFADKPQLNEQEEQSESSKRSSESDEHSPLISHIEVATNEEREESQHHQSSEDEEDNETTANDDQELPSNEQNLTPNNDVIPPSSSPRQRRMGRVEEADGVHEELEKLTVAELRERFKLILESPQFTPEETRASSRFKLENDDNLQSTSDVNIEITSSEISIDERLLSPKLESTNTTHTQLRLHSDRVHVVSPLAVNSYKALPIIAIDEASSSSDEDNDELHPPLIASKPNDTRGETQDNGDGDGDSDGDISDSDSDDEMFVQPVVVVRGDVACKEGPPAVLTRKLTPTGPQPGKMFSTHPHKQLIVKEKMTKNRSLSIIEEFEEEEEDL
jgi:hypothetical protein